MFFNAIVGRKSQARVKITNPNKVRGFVMVYQFFDQIEFRVKINLGSILFYTYIDNDIIYVSCRKSQDM